ncbi:MAG: archaeal proteasome endopeptidase complex subunit beta [Desulfurococcales archaeon]|nr:archaeal proteasome endopeptidase complex subunit beta [Desulfurococcales archaeon]
MFDPHIMTGIQQNIPEPRHGTTTVGIKLKEHVILAADKRATAGHFIASRSVKKIVKIDEHVAMTISGVVADAQTLADYVRFQIRLLSREAKIAPTVKMYATFLSRILFESKIMPFIVQLIVGGYDGKPRLYTLDLLGSVIEEEYTATGSGSPVALGVLEDGYSEDLSLDEAVELAKRAVKTATLRDSASGDGVDVVIIGRGLYEEKTLRF